MSNYELTVPVTYMTTPQLTFEEISVITPSGDAKIAGNHTWNPVTVSFSDASKVLEITLHEPIFDLQFTTDNVTWKFTGCYLTSLNLINRHEFTMHYQNAQQVHLQKSKS